MTDITYETARAYAKGVETERRRILRELSEWSSDYPMYGGQNWISMTRAQKVVRGG